MSEWRYFQLEDDDGILAKGKILREVETSSAAQRRFVVDNSFTFPPGKRTQDFSMYGRERTRSKKQYLGTVVATRSRLEPRSERDIVLGGVTPQLVVKDSSGEERRMRRRRFEKFRIS